MHSRRATPVPKLRRVHAQALPGGYKAGEKVLYTGDSETASNGEKWVHGQQGEVMGPCDGEDGEEGLLMLFPGNTGSVECPLTEVRRLRAASALPNPRLRPTHATLPITPHAFPRQPLP